MGLKEAFSNKSAKKNDGDNLINGALNLKPDLSKMPSTSTNYNQEYPDINASPMTDSQSKINKSGKKKKKKRQSLIAN